MDESGMAETIRLLKAQLAREEQANRELRLMLPQLRKIVQSQEKVIDITRPRPR